MYVCLSLPDQMMLSVDLQMRDRGAFRILNDTYVTEESGTGVVHQAPYFGEVSAQMLSITKYWQVNIFVELLSWLIFCF